MVYGSFVSQLLVLLSLSKYTYVISFLVCIIALCLISVNCFSKKAPDCKRFCHIFYLYLDYFVHFCQVTSEIVPFCFKDLTLI